jgi:glycerol-3-phosphate dehydrogenase
LRLGLIEQKHFASGTSGRNSQLIHGGLRYLKYFEFSLVRESLQERSTLLRIAPHLVEPLPFLMPMYGWKSRILYGTGLTLYDILSGSHGIRKHRVLKQPEVTSLEPSLNTRGLTATALFYDCRVHSARLVLANILDAMDRGAFAVNYLKADHMDRAGDVWNIAVRDTLSGQAFQIQARKIVDATGPWAGGASSIAPGAASLRLVRGSHVIIPRVNTSDNAIAYFDPSGRIVFLIPWGSRRQLTLVGTTDVDHSSGPEDVQITPQEIAYLLGIVDQVFPGEPNREVISTYSSLRPLVPTAAESPTSASRGHRIWNSEDGVLHIAGGKYTTYRAMSKEAAELACREIAPALCGKSLTAHAVLPHFPAVREWELEQHLSDHLYVSTYLGYEKKWDRESLQLEAEAMAPRMGWDEHRITLEIQDLMARLSPLASLSESLV